MIVLATELIALLEALPESAHLTLPDTVEVERPGESLGQLYKTPKGIIAYRMY